LGSDDPAGLCPQCLMQGVFDSSLGGNDSGIETVDTVTAGVSDDDFGRYHILRTLGEGGMGTVYLAEQREPIRRLVALKVVKLGMDTGQVLARFAKERQALAVMDHPSIARIFDAGATPKGRPYFVMEYIEGVPLTQYCDRKRMAISQRLELFLSVCRAVQHAHQKGVIHRDLKPSNVLVMEQEEEPVPKVIDFGIAKATDQWAVEKTLLTQFGQMVGTPEYASPEQAEVMTGEEVDERSDVYSLGVILYELLIGAVPFDPSKLRQKGLAEMMRIVREEEAPSLSRKLSTMGAAITDIASQRQTDPSSLRRLVDGDLNWITVKALEKLRARRYASVAELASDIERYVEHRPVLASPPSGLYRARKFVRRHRSAVVGTAAGSVFIALAGLTIWSLMHHNTSPIPKLTGKDTIVLADFDNKTGDPVFDDTLRQGLSVELQQSPFFSLISDQKIQATLALMGQPRDARLIPETARQICERSGSTAMLAGSIAALGSRYVVGLRAENCNTGSILDQEQALAANREDVLNSLSQIARKFRTRVGESLATFEKHSTPLAEATTPSLEALKAYSTGMKANLSAGSAAAVPFFRRAIEIDPQFAMAYADLGLAYSDVGESVLSAESTTKAWQLRDRVSDREKFFIDFIYEREVTGNLEKAYQTLETWYQTYPSGEQPSPHDLLGGLSTQGTGRFERAIEISREQIAADPAVVFGYHNLASSLFFLDRFAEAEKPLEQAAERKVEEPYLLVFRYTLAALKDDKEQMDRVVAQSKGKHGAEHWVAHAEALALARSGRLQDSRRSSSRAVNLALQEGQREKAASYRAAHAVWEAVCGNGAEAKSNALAALELSRGRDVQYAAGLALALSRESPRSEALANDLEKRFPEDTFVKFTYAPVLRAVSALQRGKPVNSLDELQISLPYELAANGLNFNHFYLGGLHSAYVRGVALIATHRYAEAAAEFQKILDHRGLVGLDPIGALSHLQLGRAYVLAGDRIKAKSAYEDFLSVWKNADPDTPILKSARAEYDRL
jgi:serine/threonine protein kinase/tetratricopeptide (TPR) repeat protein